MRRDAVALETVHYLHLHLHLHGTSRCVCNRMLQHPDIGDPGVCMCVTETWTQRQRAFDLGLLSVAGAAAGQVPRFHL